MTDEKPDAEVPAGAGDTPVSGDAPVAGDAPVTSDETPVADPEVPDTAAVNPPGSDAFTPVREKFAEAETNPPDTNT